LVIERKRETQKVRGVLMKSKIIAYLLSCLLTPFIVLANDLQVHDDYLPRYGDFYRPRDGTLQEYNDYVPRYGDYLKRERDRLQVYDDYVPDYGDYYKWNGRRWQKYEDYVPDYGDFLEDD